MNVSMLSPAAGEPAAMAVAVCLGNVFLARYSKNEEIGCIARIAVKIDRNLVPPSRLIST